MTRQMPRTIVAGDTLKVLFTLTEYNANEGWTLQLKAGGPSGAPIPYFYTATNEDGCFLLHLSPLLTAAFGKGFYSYAVIVTDGTDEYSVERGSFEVELRPDLNFDSDLRTHARKVLDAIEAVIENRATVDQSSYSIAGRSLTRMPIEELMKFRNIYRAQVAKDEGRERYKMKMVLRSL